MEISDALKTLRGEEELSYEFRDNVANLIVMLIWQRNHLMNEIASK